MREDLPDEMPSRHPRTQHVGHAQNVDILKETG